MTEPTNEFQPDMSWRPSLALEAFDAWVDVAEAEESIGMKAPVPGNTLGLAMSGILTSKPSDSGRAIILEFEEGLTVAALDLGSDAAAEEFVESQCGPEAGEHVSRPDVAGHTAIAWGSVDTGEVELGPDGSILDGSGVVTTAAQVMWADGTRVIWVNHMTMEVDDLLEVARSIYRK